MGLTPEEADVTAAVTGGRLPDSLRIAAGALSLHCLCWGATGDPVALLVHGNGGHAHWWDPIVPALMPGWRLIVPDLRGHGDSDWAEPPSYRIEDFASDLLAVLDHMGCGRVALIGHSMGGRACAWLAIHHPERLAALALFDTRLGAVHPEVAQRYRGRVAGQRDGRRYATRAEAIAAFRFVPDERNVPPAVIADLAHHAVRERSGGEWAFRFDRAVLALDGDGAGDLFPLLSRIACPTLIMNGKRSWVMDAAECAAISAAIRDCSIETSPGGHHFLVAHAAAVGRTLRGFIDRVGGLCSPG